MLDDSALTRTLRQKLEEDDLCGGRVPGFGVTLASYPKGAVPLSNPLADFRVSRSSVTTCETADRFWEWERPKTTGLVSRVGRALLADARARPARVANRLAELVELLASEHEALLLPAALKTSKPPPRALGRPILYSAAVLESEVYLVHARTTAKYNLEPSAGLQDGGLGFRVVLSVPIARVGDAITEVSRVAVPFGVVLDLLQANDT